MLEGKKWMNSDTGIFHGVNILDVKKCIVINFTLSKFKNF